MVAQAISEETPKPQRRYIATPRYGTTVTDHDAKVIGPYLETLAAEHNADIPNLPPEVIVEAARADSSPIHRYFEWDQAKGHYQYLLWQARHLARSFRIVIVTSTRDEPTRFSLPGMLSVVTQGNRGYVPVQTVLEHPELRAQIKADFDRKLESLYRDYQQYRGYAEFADRAAVFAEIEKAFHDEKGQRS